MVLEKIEQWTKHTACPGNVYVEATHESEFRIFVWCEPEYGAKELIAEVLPSATSCVVLPGEGQASSWAYELEDALKSNPRF